MGKCLKIYFIFGKEENMNILLQYLKKLDIIIEKYNKMCV
jgi:hypothetical protein